MAVYISRRCTMLLFLSRLKTSSSCVSRDTHTLCNHIPNNDSSFKIPTFVTSPQTDLEFTARHAQAQIRQVQIR